MQTVPYADLETLDYTQRVCIKFFSIIFGVRLHVLLSRFTKSKVMMTILVCNMCFLSDAITSRGNHSMDCPHVLIFHYDLHLSLR